MARAAGSKDYLSFGLGLVTEASPLSFPDGATARELNFLIASDGQRRIKRKGLEDAHSIQDSYSISATPDQVTVQGVHYWRDAEIYVTVFRANNTMVFQANGVNGTDYGSYTYIIGVEHGEVTDVTIFDNYMVLMTADNASHILVEYQESYPRLLFRSFSLYTRDFELVPDGLGVDERPSTLSDNHKYNLLNADWWARRKSGASTFVDPITKFRTDSGGTEYPSNADVAKLGIKTDSNGDEIFSRDTLLETPLGSSEAPRGHFVYALDDTDRTARLTNPEISGAPASTIEEGTLGTIDLSGI